MIEVYPKRPYSEGLGPLVDPSHGRHLQSVHRGAKGCGQNRQVSAAARGYSSSLIGGGSEQLAL